MGELYQKSPGLSGLCGRYVYITKTYQIPGGVRQFYGQLHTTTGNLQGNFAIFAIKTNFAPHAHGTFPDFHKIFPKQITGNLFQKTSFSLIF